MPSEEEKKRIIDFIASYPEMDYEMGSTIWMWCKNFPEEVEKYKSGELKFEHIERFKGENGDYVVKDAAAC